MRDGKCGAHTPRDDDPDEGVGSAGDAERREVPHVDAVLHSEQERVPDSPQRARRGDEEAAALHPVARV